MANYNSLLEGFQAQPKGPLDTTGDYKKLLEGFQPAGAVTAPQISPETVQEATKQPQGRPAAPQEEQVVDTGPVFPQLTQAGATAAQGIEAIEQEGIQLSPYLTGAYGQPAPSVRTIASEAPMQLSQEAQESAKQFIREDALPVVGATVGALLAPTTGGSSIFVSSAMIGAAAGAGGFVGEAAEQIGKKEGIMTLGKGEEAPKDAWDILERSAWRGGEEALWAMVPDLFVKGVTQGTRRLLLSGGKKTIDEAGQPIDMGRRALQDVMSNYAEKHGMKVDEVLLTSDVVDTGLFNAAENVASNSYITSQASKIRDVQAEALKGTITETTGKYMDPALGYVQSTSDAAIQRFIEPNLQSMNDFAVAGLVNVGFKKAQDAQKAVARATYKAIGNLMERTRMETVYKEVELPILGPNGRPMTTMQEVQVERPAFPVNLRGVRQIGEERMDILARTGERPDSTTASFLNMPVETDYEAATERLIDMKADSRSLGKSTAEGAAKQKLVLDKAITELESAMEAAMQQADASGIVTPDGRSLYELKKEADAIWKEQVEDFQNSYLMNIIKNTNPKNGAPEKLGSLFMKNETAARNIMKVLDDAKGSLQGEALEQITQAENAIKGSIVEQIFMPFDSASGKYMAPDVRAVRAKKEELSRIFGDEGYDELSKLAAAIEQQAGSNMSNYLGFAQRARESGMVAGTIKGMLRADFGPLIRDGSSTILFAMGAGRLLTSPKMIRQARMLMDPKVDPAVKTSIAQWLVHRTYEYQQSVDASMTPEERERFEAKLEDIKEAERIRKGN